jgi:endoglucanase
MYKHVKRVSLLLTKIVLCVALWLGGVYAINHSSLTKNSDIVRESSMVVTASGELIDIWWPAGDTRIDNTQTFKALLKDKNLSQYKMYWQVGNGSYTEMYDSMTDYPHKEAVVDLSGWSWEGIGPYHVSFIAHDHSGNEIAKKTVVIMLADTPARRSVVKGAVTSVPEASTINIATKTVSDQLFDHNDVNVWWPTDGSTLQGLQQFKAVVKGADVGNYDMFWKVDNGSENRMSDNLTPPSHKSASVDVSGWRWSDRGEYRITFIAKKKDGSSVKERSVTVRIGAGATSAARSLSQESTSMAATPSAALSANGLYVDPNSPARRQANEWRVSRPADADQMDKIAREATAVWFGNWNADVTRDVRAVTSNARAHNAAAVLVAYNIPIRDCGSYSAGGANSAQGYRQWIQAFANGIASDAIVVLEPDAISGLDCLSEQDRSIRYDLIKDAVRTLKAKGNVKVYIDAGHANWHSTDEIARRLERAGVREADGFSLNVSNFIDTNTNIKYGEIISRAVSKPFVIDTSRNGAGAAPGGEWCNPSGRALGQRPTLRTGNSHINAYLWIKVPGESDGSCNGGPGAGHWWADYALGLARRAAY